MNREKKLRLIISSMKQKQLLKFFDLFLESTQCQFSKSIKQISYSCYESTCQIESYVVNGYGKTQMEALVSGINNLVDCLVEDDGYCEGMKQAIRMSNNVSGFNYLHGLSGGNSAGTCSKKLLSTQKPIKTMASQTPTIIQEKKLLTMSANMSSSSKQSSSKSKSIKQEIFEYFNLQNVKVKNPSGGNQQKMQQQFCTLGQVKQSMGNQYNQIQREKRSVTTYSNNNISNSLNTSHNNNIIINQRQPQTAIQSFNTTTSTNTQHHHYIKTTDQVTSQIQMAYRRIREMKQQISMKQKQNLKLKQQIHSKRAKLIIGNSNNTNNSNNISHVVLTEGNTGDSNGSKQLLQQQQQSIHSTSANNTNGQYFSRQSLQPKPNRKVSQPIGTQSTKKLSYLQMSLNNDKLLAKSNQLQQRQSSLNNNNNKQNTLQQQQKGVNIKKDSVLNTNNNNQQQLSKQYKLISKYNLQNANHHTKQQFVECEFVNVQLKSSITHNTQSQIQSTNLNFPGSNSSGHQEQQLQQQRRCLVDLTNFNNANLSNINNPSTNTNNQKPYLLKNNIIQTTLTPKSDLYHFHTIKQNMPQQPMKQTTFQTVKLPTQQPSRHQLLYQKITTQQSSVMESSKKLRSFSVQNQLTDKVGTLNPNKSNNPLLGSSNNNSNTNQLMLNSISNNNMNASFDNGNAVSLGHNNKKIKIPKLNLEILPNYHGKSNKSLNQSLMDNYSKNKASSINIGGQQ